ncbi:ABC transporter substrate-binding protein [Protaetiibacter intestinalis]|uniref:Sugar ABC transporter substrate-binding protein n=1 Tax=Protaetiibacter intestinalis TaxID=2419774 RepID=A0A387B5T3_9MICO|nr:sugar ABC transporter substrate-binding protein [Protaetiibacter intestinalis]AYF98992.1 sugar ABC transporter substrate-binding protein [Protaetiibacter intestinalis]
MFRASRAVAATAAAFLAALALAACTNGVQGGAPTDPEHARIGLLLPDSVTARYDSADRPYFEERIAELCPGCEVLYGNADGDAAKQQQQAESMLTQGVSVLVLDPFDGKAAASIVGLATARSVPVIAYDRLIDSADIAYYISFDNEKVGRLQAESLLAKLDEDGVEPGEGGILMVNGSPTDNNASQFKLGAHAVIDPSGYTVLAEFDTPGWDPAKAQDWVTGQITQFGDRIVGVYAANDPTAGGAIASLRAAGVSPLPPVTGQDAELAGLQRILTGDQYMTVYKALKPEAYRAAELAIDLVNGRTPAGEVQVEVKGTDIPSFLLVPVAVTLDQVGPVVIADGFFTLAQLCTPDYAAACAAAGLE